VPVGYSDKWPALYVSLLQADHGPHTRQYLMTAEIHSVTNETERAGSNQHGNA